MLYMHLHVANHQIMSNIKFPVLVHFQAIPSAGAFVNNRQYFMKRNSRSFRSMFSLLLHEVSSKTTLFQIYLFINVFYLYTIMDIIVIKMGRSRGTDVNSNDSITYPSWVQTSYGPLTPIKD